MQLIQIGETKQKTVLDLVQEMSTNQFAEIQQLKMARQNVAATRRSDRLRPRCKSNRTTV